MALFSQRQNNAFRESVRKKRTSIGAPFLFDPSADEEVDDAQTTTGRGSYGRLLQVDDAHRGGAPPSPNLNRSPRNSAIRGSVARLSIIDLALDSDLLEHSWKSGGTDKEDDDGPTTCCGRLKAVYDALHLKHLVPFLILVVYSLLGAALFYWIEHDNEQEVFRQRERDVSEKRELFMEHMREIMTDGRFARVADRLNATRQSVIWYERQLQVGTRPNMIWDYVGALYYVGTLYTTIGYGNIGPRTTAGRVLTIIYAVFGVPLVLAIVNNVGKLLCTSITRLWKAGERLFARLRTILYTAARRKPRHNGLPADEAPTSGGTAVSVSVAADGDSCVVKRQRKDQAPTFAGATLSSSMASNDSSVLMRQSLDVTQTTVGAPGGNVTMRQQDVDGGVVMRKRLDEAPTKLVIDTADEEEYEESETMPVAVSLIVCVTYLMSCAALFKIWETKWSYFESFYFFFISLSTIGLGDVVPEKPEFLIFGFLLVIVGLSIVAMVINVIQIKIEEWLFRVMRMIQKEYEKAMEMGDSPERDALLKKIMKKQPFFVRQLAPQLMTQRQTDHLQQYAARTVATQGNSKAAQTERPATSLRRLPTASMGVQTEAPPSADFCVGYRVPCRDGATQDERAEPAECWVQTEDASTRDQAQQLSAENNSSLFGSAENMVASTPPQSPPTKPRMSRQGRLMFSDPDLSSQWSIPEWFFASPTDVSELGVQTEATPLQTASSQTDTDVTRAPKLGRQMRIELDDTSCQTAPIGLKEMPCQTTDSYLKIAKRLNVLRTNRTDSLHIMAAGAPPRKKSLPYKEEDVDALNSRANGKLANF